MTVAVSNLATNKVNVLNTFDSKEKDTLRLVTRASAGWIAVCTEQENGAAVVTPANTNLRVNGLRAGRRYLVDAKVLTSNATVANGSRIALNLTGTQTTAVLAATLLGTSTVAFTTVTATAVTALVAGAVITPSVTLALGTAYGIGGTGGGGPVQYNVSGILIPQNDGDLIIQVGSGLNSTQSRLDVGSVLQVREITF